MVTHPLHRRIDPVVKRPHHRCACHQPHVRQAGKFRHHPRRPIRPRRIAHRERLRVQPPTHAEILIRQNHPRTRPPRRLCRHQPRWPRANDKHIAMQEPLVIRIRVFLPRQRAKPRRPPDDRLINLFPERLRPHERLVIKPRRKERIQPVIHRQRIKPQPRPCVLTARLQPLKQFRHRRPRIRLRPRAAAQMHQRIRLLRPRR